MDDLLSEKEQIENMRAWWSVYGRYVIAGVVIGALVLYGINDYRSGQREAQYQASALYDSLTDEVVDGDLDAAESIVNQLLIEHPDSPYATQARFAIARLYMDKNRDQDAADTLSGVLAANVDEEFKAVAKVRLAKVLLYQNKAQEVVDLLHGHADDAFASRYAEALGDAYVALDRVSDARMAYEQALVETGTGATVDQSFVQLKLLDLPIEDAAEEAAEDAAEDVAEDVAEDAQPEVADEAEE